MLVGGGGGGGGGDGGGGVGRGCYNSTLVRSLCKTSLVVPALLMNLAVQPLNDCTRTSTSPSSNLHAQMGVGVGVGTHTHTRTRARTHAHYLWNEVGCKMTRKGK